MLLSLDMTMVNYVGIERDIAKTHFKKNINWGRKI